MIQIYEQGLSVEVNAPDYAYPAAAAAPIQLMSIW